MGRQKIHHLIVILLLLPIFLRTSFHVAEYTLKPYTKKFSLLPLITLMWWYSYQVLDDKVVQPHSAQLDHLLHEDVTCKGQVLLSY